MVPLMKLSIAVPSLNYGRFLDSCLGSIAFQIGVDFEVLIADGGSVDGSLDIVQRYTDRDPRFRLVSTEDRGQADAVQRAFESSTGDIFGFLNADDCYLRRDALALVTQAFDEAPEAAIISFGGRYIQEDGREIRPVRLRYHPLDGIHWMRYRTAILQPATFWRREVQENIPFCTDLQFAFDAWFFYQAYSSYPWLELTEEIAGYRIHDENKSVGVRADRVAELAMVERLKFGEGSRRARYLQKVAGFIRALDRLKVGRTAAKRALYLSVNAFSYASAYRVPGI
jgi:glycosyltransferase involved in cell wall biosynthesis